MICTVGELHAMDLGTHMHVMEEWNEGSEAEFGWQDAMVVLHGYYTRVIQEDSIGGLYVCTYVSGGEGDLQSLRVYTDVSPASKAHTPAPHSAGWVNWDLRIAHKIGDEMWWHKGKENSAPL